MKKLILMALLYSTFTNAAELGEVVDTNFSTYICTLDERTEMTQFLCLDKITGERFDSEVTPIETTAVIATLKEQGVEFITADQPDYVQLLQQFFPGFDPSKACFVKVQYTAQQFNAFASNSPNIARARAVANALKQAGVCQQEIKRNRTGFELNVTNHDELLQHFLCVSNHESTFGRGIDNIGIGGRGPFGINPMHVRNADGVCKDLPEAVQSDRGTKAERGARYENATARRQNAACALRLYSSRDYRDWGTTRNTSWGTNKFCTSTQRQRYNFERNLGEAACCSNACKQRVARAQGRQRI